MKYVICLLLMLVASTTEARWFKYSPRGSVDNQGIFKDVFSRTEPEGIRRMYDADRITRLHETLHWLNRQIRDVMGVDDPTHTVLYIGKGKCLLLREPKVTLKQVARYVPRGLRDCDTFDTYFIQSSQHYERRDRKSVV